MRTVYRNARIVGPAVRRDGTFVVRDGVFESFGNDDEHSAARVIDLDGALVTAAFVDAHVHLTATGLALGELDLTAATSLADLLRQVERAARASGGRPVLGSGWDDTTWPERRAPTAPELDRASYGGVVYLARVDAHSAVVSSALLAAMPDIRAADGYRPDGLLTRAAHDAARVVALDTVDPRRIEQAQRTALQRAASFGIACVHEMGGPAISSADDLASAVGLGRDAALPEVIGYWGELFGIDAALDLGAHGAGGDLFCDGSLGSHTAALHEPYDDRPDSTGMLRFDVADLAEHVVRCEAAGLQAGFHAIGDAAVDQVLAAVELARTRRPVPPPAPHRVEHAEYVREPERLAASGLVASMQPMFDAAWGGDAGMYATRLGPKRARRLNRFADLRAAGVPLAFGSDAPVTALGPWAAVRAAVRPHDPSMGIEVAAALAAHTSGGWRAAGRPGGALVVGAPATFAVWRAALGADGHPELGADGDLPTCLATVRDGVPIHDTGLLGSLA